MGLTMDQNENSPRQTQNDQDHHNTIQTHKMAESASLELHSTTTKAENVGQRMCWTTDINEHLARCYYIIIY